MVYPVKPLVIGSKGFIGGHFYRFFLQQFPNLIGTDRENLDLKKPVLDFSVLGYSHALITAAVTNLDVCENDPKMSYQCNVRGPLELGQQLIEKGVTPIFFSTDYVFNGVALEYDACISHSPLNTYGRQKAELEIGASKLDALVVRLSKVYGIEKGDGTLLDEMADNLTKGQSIAAATDQILTPVCVEDVIKGVTSLMHLGMRGIVNISSQIEVSRWDIANGLAKQLNVDEKLVKKIQLKNLKDAVNRPKRVKLISRIPTISWEEGVKKMVEQYAK